MIEKTGGNRPGRQLTGTEPLQYMKKDQ